ncbi:PREDICTED: uncharacterized protein LOC104609583 isoform X2 [Nelumbo nucifera]|uniref:Uncharacterized protein LOC104609583 isoform X2 n=2 Tax=Nelumbo nucifera TaxID=4432 RepID=A0A1U8B0T3_NELNU|nr:PREDICTED: uncharacterized protein LOC104609583 isoform X2 [Nelumbo nucifera]DAD36638.1 TPA_asm: hypothetical protein HUJ06_007279 [Nelumbo nucifera]
MTPNLLCPFWQQLSVLEISAGNFCLIGQCQENPLLLLGQYSDDELEDESNEKDTNDVTENSLIEDNGQVKEAADTESGVLENNTGKDVAAQLVMVEDVEKDATHSNAASNLNDAEIRGSDATASGEPHNQADAAAQVSDPGSSGVQIIGEVVSGWKIVMHEESGRYYYWNTETGETSWEPPGVLAQGSEITTELNTPHITEEKENPSRDTHASSPIFHLNVSAINEPEGSILAPETQENCENGFHEKKWNGHRVESQDVLNLSFNTEQIESTESSVTLNVLHQQALSLGDYVSVQQSNSALSSTIGPATTAHDDKDEKPTVVSEQHESAVALSSSLVKYGESLLKRLTSLEGYNNHDQRYDWISKYTMEVEIRLADIKSLLAYGSPLLPFWVHCEAQFKQLDCAINDQVLQFDKSEQLNKVEHHPVSSFRGDGISLQSMGRESEVGEKDQVLTSANETQYISPDVDKVNLGHREAHGRHTSVDNTNTNHALSSGLPTELSKEVEEKLQKLNETALPDAFISKNATRIGEDIDMDVEMEVDEAPANSMTGDSLVTKVFPPLEQQNQTTPPSVECPTIEPGNEIAAPPPPDEEWIPPPPPDAEPLPPPPPDEPLPSYPPPPPYSETVPSLCYAEQYNLGYSVSNFNYYGATMTEVPMANYYAHGETHQLAEPQPVQYYDTVQNTYPEAAPAMVNPVPTEPVVYYDLPNGPMPPVTVITSSESGFYNESGPVVSSMESSGLYCESGSVSYHDTAASVQMGSVETLAESGSSSLPSSKVEPDFSTNSVSAQVLPKQPAVESMTTVVCESAPATAASTAAPAASKAQSKALRGKKRTIAVAPTLRSNKKVSSLVDKWKAVKEELHEDGEDEPEYAYEILEKKRQKEIVQWRAQQIASGEAKDNANFQPLGGDWRERVKRKRAQLTNDSVQAQSEIPANEKQQPDLVELSKDLPSGWQAYWDDSSKEVYYGNVLTSETTWTRPT